MRITARRADPCGLAFKVILSYNTGEGIFTFQAKEKFYGAN